MLKPNVVFNCEKCGAPATDTVQIRLSIWIEKIGGSELNTEPGAIELHRNKFFWRLAAEDVEILCGRCLNLEGNEELRREAKARLTVLDVNKPEHPEAEGDKRRNQIRIIRKGDENISKRKSSDERRYSW